MAERRRRGGEAADGRDGASGDARRGDEPVDEDAVLDDSVTEDPDAVADEDIDADAIEDSDVEGDAGSGKSRRGLVRGGRGTATKAKSKSADKKPAKGRTTERVGLFARFFNFVREVVAELRKVIWPTRSELLTYTAVVVVFVTVMLSIVGVLDFGFGKLALWVFGGKTTSGS